MPCNAATDNITPALLVSTRVVIITSDDLQHQLGHLVQAQLQDKVHNCEQLALAEAHAAVLGELRDLRDQLTSVWAERHDLEQELLGLKASSAHQAERLAREAHAAQEKHAAQLAKCTAGFESTLDQQRKDQLRKIYQWQATLRARELELGEERALSVALSAKLSAPLVIDAFDDSGDVSADAHIESEDGTLQYQYRPSCGSIDSTSLQVNTPSPDDMSDAFISQDAECDGQSWRDHHVAFTTSEHLSPRTEASNIPLDCAGEGGMMKTSKTESLEDGEPLSEYMATLAQLYPLADVDIASLSFATSKSNGREIGLAEYVARMKRGQDDMYYITGGENPTVSSEACELHDPDLEVLFLFDPVDECILQQLKKFDGKMFTSVCSRS